MGKHALGKRGEKLKIRKSENWQRGEYWGGIQQSLNQERHLRKIEHKTRTGTELKNYDTYYDYDNNDDNDDGYGNDDDNDDGYGKGRWDVSRGGVLLASLASSNTALKGASCQCW